ncbi:reverse transcriptase [Phytophthora megakarya]|uniref:Reverse transcriptase n=1 Tax=Phytophthora megakarya TaxID=4795 RepID=A0A225W814_9STRA|nr:reverse transcriptase [Phytophthora megakarya]
MCIDNRLVNDFIELSNYPLPLIDDGFEHAMWFMSLDMASDVWAVRMTERVKRIPAFVCPFEHFQWIRISFGLKNAPLIYREMINNCLWGSGEDGGCGCSKLGLDLSERGEAQREYSGREVPILTNEMTAFKRNIPSPSQIGPVLGLSSYIDDIAHGALTWDQLCEGLDALLYRLCYWNTFVGLPKSEFGKLTIPYLPHGIHPGVAIPDYAQRGSLNCYHKFIEDYSVVAAVLHVVTEDQIKAGRELSRDKESFEILKRKIVSTPLLRHPDRNKPFMIILHANRQQYDRKILSVHFTDRVLNETETRYHVAEKEVIAIMRGLDVFENLLRGCPIKVYTGYSVLSWLLKSKIADGRCVRWGDLEIQKVQSGEDVLAAIMGAGITPHEQLDEVAESLIPLKRCIKPQPVNSVEMLDADFEGYVLSFDGAANTSTHQGSCGCKIWKLPGFILEDVTVNDARIMVS